MSRRARAIGFGLLALLAAALAAAIVDGYRSRAVHEYGPLRSVVVVERGLRPGSPLALGDVGGLTQRRVPVRFVPSGALQAPTEALGLEPTAAVPAGSYLLAAQLRPPRRATDGPGPALAGDRRPVEIGVSGAEALLATDASPHDSRVDVIVTTEPSGAGAGRTYVAATDVPLLALGPGADGPGPGGIAAATLGLTKRQALRLIAAESFARKLTLLPGG